MTSLKIKSSYRRMTITRKFVSVPNATRFGHITLETQSISGFVVSC